MYWAYLDKKINFELLQYKTKLNNHKYLFPSSFKMKV